MGFHPLAIETSASAEPTRSATAGSVLFAAYRVPPRLYPPGLGQKVPRHRHRTSGDCLMRSHPVGTSATVATYKLTYKELRTGVSLTTAEAHTITLVATVDRVRLVGMFFDLNKCFLLPSAMHGIRKIRAQYDEHPNANLLIVGHTDTSGKDDYNLALSLERSNAVAAYLTDDVPSWDAYFAASKPNEKRWGLLEVQLHRAPLRTA